MVVRLIFAALAGIALGTVCTAALAPFLWHFKSSRGRIAERAIQVGVVLVMFVDSRFALTILIKAWWSHHGPRFTARAAYRPFSGFRRSALPSLAHEEKWLPASTGFSAKR